MRRDPKIIEEAQKILDDENAQIPKPEKPLTKSDEKFLSEQMRRREFGVKESKVFKRLKDEYKDLSGDALYDSTTLKSEAIKASKLMEENPQEAYRIAMGAKDSSEVTSTAVNIAMTERALAEGNNTLAARLIKNRSLTQTRRGQEISMERASVTNNSAQRYVKELIQARMALVKVPLGEQINNVKLRGRKAKITDIIDSEAAKIEKAVKFKEFDVQKAQSFIDELRCK